MRTTAAAVLLVIAASTANIPLALACLVPGLALATRKR
jgi:hypothetical protein